MKNKTDSEEAKKNTNSENKNDSIALSKEEYEKKYYTIPMLDFDNFDVVEPELVPITPKYSQYDAFDSLRLPINFSKMPSLDSAVLAYNIFLQKGRDRSKYLVNIVMYCDSHKTDTNPEMRRVLSYLRYLKMIKMHYKIETKGDIRELLGTDKNSTEYQNIQEKAMKMEDVRNAMFGLYKHNNKSRVVFNKLFDCTPTDRIIAISRYVEQYIYDGYDYPIQIQLMYKTLKELIDDYHNYPDDKFLMNNLQIMLELADEIIDTRTVMNPVKESKKFENITDEISSLFSNDADFTEFLR